MVKKGFVLLLMLFMVLSVLTACGGQGNNQAAPDAKNGADAPQQSNPAKAPPATQEPVKLTMFQWSAAITDEEFQKFIAEPVKTKYPNITVELLRSQKGQTINDLIAANTLPDLLFIGSNAINEAIDLGTVEDLNPYVKTNKMDLKKFDASVMKGIDNYSNNGELFTLPFSINFGLMVYNKDIFDKFGVPYPKDDMSWDEAIQLGKKLARTEGGVTYKPLHAGPIQWFVGPLEQPFADPKTDKPLLDTPAMQKALTLYKSITDLPGNQSSTGNGREAFIKDQNLAMMPDFGAVIGELDAEGKFNWDLTTVPYMNDYPHIGRVTGPFLLSMVKQSAHKDAAFKALEVMLSDENQIKVTRSGRLSALIDDKIKQNFGADLASLNGKNIQSIFKNPSAVVPRDSEYRAIPVKAFADAADKVVSGKLDVVSALREAQDTATGLIQAEKAKK